MSIFTSAGSDSGEQPRGAGFMGQLLSFLWEHYNIDKAPLRQCILMGWGLSYLHRKIIIETILSHTGSAGNACVGGACVIKNIFKMRPFLRILLGKGVRFCLLLSLCQLRRMVGNFHWKPPTNHCIINYKTIPATSEFNFSINLSSGFRTLH